MNSKFFDLKKEKQDRMINAALKIFAIYGYKRASTDDIVREAGISKGLLFHYFESKIGLYSFIFDYSVRFMAIELKTAISPTETDMFKIVLQSQSAIMQVIKNYPYMQRFLESTKAENVSEALLTTESRRNELEEIRERMNFQMNVKNFPPGVDGKKVKKILYYTIQGIVEEHFREGSFQADMVYEEIKESIQMLEKVLRK